MNPIDIALRIATTAHAGQLDRDGNPVILHPLTVGLMGHTDEAFCMTWLKTRPIHLRIYSKKASLLA